MPESTRTVSPGPKPSTLLFEDGTVVEPPAGWTLLPPGDAGLTRRVKKSGPSWTVVERRRRRNYSQGVWAPKANIETALAEVAAQRQTPQYQRRQQAAARKREQVQRSYVDDFRRAVLGFLNFPPRHVAMSVSIAEAVTSHATPVGSGTVARTSRIPIERRAEAAVIAWMRHQTTAYDHLSIPRVKGKRREVRALLAAESRRLLQAYRDGADIDLKLCPLGRALRS